MDDLIRIVLVVAVAALAYYLIVPLAGAPVVVGAIAAVLVLLVGLRPNLPGRL